MDQRDQERLSPSIWQRTDDVCDLFEQAWLNGPAIANYLGNAAGQERNRLLSELLRLDIHHRKRNGSSKTEQEYAALLQSDAAAVQEYFKNLVVPVSDTQSVPGDTNRGHTSGDNSETDLPSWSAPRFRTIRSHAKGGLGEVFLAEDLEFEREVALKEIQRSKLEHAAARRDFSREGRITGRLEHPNIAPVYSLGQFEDGRPFYVMRFIRGASLKEALARFHGASPQSKSAKDKPSPEAMSAQTEKAETATSQNRDLELRQLLGSFVQVCNAVAYAHSKGIIHRDIKPANIMLGDFGETLLVDWGLARAMGDADGAQTIASDLSTDDGAATQEGQIKGTPAYMSPEQARGDITQLGPATDVYSLGATLYTLLTGQIPVEGKSTDEYLTNVIAGRVMPPRLRTPQRAIAKPLDAICMKAMALDPAERYASARLLAADIEHYLADEPVTAIADPITVRTRRWLRKHPAMATAATLLLLVGLAGSLGFAALERNHGLEIAKKQKESEENFQDAMAAVGMYVKTAQDVDLLREERFKPHLIALLTDAHKFYQQFIEKHNGRADRMSDLANALTQVGAIHLMSGDLDDAQRAYRQAIESYRSLAQQQPNVSEHHRGIFNSYNALGALQYRTSDFENAQQNFVFAVQVGESVVRQSPEDVESGLDLANCYNSLGLLQQSMSKLHDAEESYRRAIALQEALLKRNPALIKYQKSLGAVYNNLGTLQINRSDLDGACESFLHAIEIGKALVKEDNNVDAYQIDLAGSYNNLGLLQVAMLDYSGAQSSYREAIEIQKRLIKKNPTVARFQSGLAQSYGNLGSLFSAMSETNEAEDAFEHASKIAERLVQEYSQVAEYRAILGHILNSRGNLQFAAADLESAKASFRRAIEIRQELTQRNSAEVKHKSDLAASQVNLANAEYQEGHYALARDLLRQAQAGQLAAITAEPDNPEYRWFYRGNRAMLVATALQMGVHAEAVKAAGEWSTYARDPVDGAAAAAHICKCIALAKKDATLSEEAKKQAVQEYGNAAMEILTRLVNEGVNGERLTDPAALGRPEFLPLTLRKDFQELLGSLGNADQ